MFALLMASLTARADMVSSSFTLPGAVDTLVWGIGNGGQLVGQVSMSSADPGFAFVYDAGILTKLTGPSGSIGSSAIAISNDGHVVGDYQTMSPATGLPVNHAFIYQAGSYSTPNLGLIGVSDLEFRGISPDGRYLSGFYLAASGDRQPGFVYDLSAGHMVATLDDGPGSYVIAQGINSYGQVVGSRNVAGSNSSFLYDIGTGQRSNFNFSGTSGVRARGINDLGQITGWLTDNNGQTHAWVGTAAGYQPIPDANGQFLVAEGINNLGQVVGFNNPATHDAHYTSFIYSPAVLPSSPATGGAYTFSTAVVADVPIFIDPLVAVGYSYQIGAGNPLFKTVSLPAGIDDDVYEIVVGGQHFTVHGNEIFDFTTHGFAAGVEAFTVNGIEPQVMLDPNNAQAFVTRLTFAGSGVFTGTQTALTMDYTAAVPEPSPAWLMLAGVGLLFFLFKRRA